MKKGAIIYCRVSTKEQAQDKDSLKTQEADCRAFSLKNGYQVEKVFVGAGESAKTQNRPELKELLKYVVANKSKIGVLIVWKLDRLSRNISDYYSLRANFSSLGIVVLSVTENNEDSSMGELTRGFASLVAHYENSVKRERTIRAMTELIKSGRWCGRAPIGLKQTRDQLNRTFLMPNAESKFIERAFDLAKTGLYTQIQIVHILRKEGFNKINKGLLNRILRNYLYTGLIKCKWFPEVVEGIHKPIVSKETFFCVQDILDGKKPKIAPKLRNHPDFPLRGLIKCADHDKKLTGSKSTGRKGIRYPYYRCMAPKCPLNVKKSVLEGVFYEYLQSIQPKIGIVKLFEVVVLDVWHKKQEDTTKEVLRHEKELKDLKSKRDRIEELMIDGTFDDATYKRKAQDIENELMVKQIELNETKIDLDDIQACLNYAKGFLINASNVWLHADLDTRQRFQHLVFPEGLTYKTGGSFGTTRMSSIFSLLQNLETAKSNMATPAGFEPASSP